MRNTCLLCMGLLICCMDLSAGVEGALTREYTAQRGTALCDHLVLSNPTDEPITYQLRITDYRCTADGSHFFEECDDNPYSSASWTHLSRRSVTVPPRGRCKLNYTITPPDAELAPGSYSCILLVEPTCSSGEGAVQVRVRYACQLVTTVGQAPFKVALRCPTTDIDEKWSGELHNDGVRFIKAELECQCFDSTGHRVKELQWAGPKLPPGSAMRISIPTDDLPLGSYRAFIIVRHERQILLVKQVTFEKCVLHTR